MVSSPLAVSTVRIPIVPEHGGTAVNRLEILFLICSEPCLGPLRLSNAYRGVVMTRVMLRVALLALLLTPRAATAQDPRQNTPGQFDFYVLSLSWSPSFCAGAAERVARNANVQCGPRPYSFVFMGCGR